jgi:hypothetical protein
MKRDEIYREIPFQKFKTFGKVSFTPQLPPSVFSRLVAESMPLQGLKKIMLKNNA